MAEIEITNYGPPQEHWDSMVTEMRSMSDRQIQNFLIDLAHEANKRRPKWVTIPRAEAAHFVIGHFWEGRGRRAPLMNSL